MEEGGYSAPYLVLRGPIRGGEGEGEARKAREKGGRGREEEERLTLMRSWNRGWPWSSAIYRETSLLPHVEYRLNVLL